MKTNLFSYNSILFTLIIILISTITIWKLPQTQNGYTHIGIAVYDMDDTFINDYVTKLQNKIDRSSFSGKKVLYEIFDAEGNANRQEHQLQYMYTQNFDALLINLVTPSSAASVLNETANHDIPVILFNREADKKDLSHLQTDMVRRNSGKKSRSHSGRHAPECMEYRQNKPGPKQK